MTQEITKIESNSPAEMIKIAVTGGADLEKLEKLLELQERWDRNEAKKAYHKAMAAFKANPPTIIKDKKVSFSTSRGQTAYNHASLQNVCTEINKSLSQHGLSSSWRVNQNGSVSVTCRITHELGHSEETTLTAPADDSGSKNKIQQIGSTITYLERYTLLALVGLATRDQDDDGQVSDSDSTPVSEEKMISLREWMLSKNVNDEKLLKWLKIDSMDLIDEQLCDKAIQGLKNSGGKK